MRWFWRGLVGLLALLSILTAAGYLWLRGSLPTLDGELVAPGLRAPVEIVRDRFGVPHIFAQNRADSLFALGFVHAQDRLWQMETMRRIGAGRLAEVLGPRAIESDRMMRVLDLHGVAGRNYARLDADSRALIDAYVAGVNAQLMAGEQSLPPEFLLLRHEPEPWTAADSLLWLKLMALDLSTNWSQELFRQRLASRLTAQQIAEFYTPYRDDEPRGPLAGPLVPSTETGSSMPPPPLNAHAAEGLGSNNWAVAAKHSATGKPLLANDPHLRLRTPSIWYFAHLSWPDRKLVGATLPGLPSVVLGRNDRIAWSFANTGSDVQDVYVEQLVEGRADLYQTPDGPRPFSVRRETIRVRDGADVTVDLRSTRHGPVLNDASAELDALAEPGQVLSLAWTALADDDATARAGLQLAVTDRWEAFVDALRDLHTPQQNIIYADVEGNIGFIAPGRVPLREPENQIQGFTPQPGWDAKFDWRGYVPFEALPRSLNPRSGMLLSANHKIVPDDYPYHLTFEWAHGYRAGRIAHLLSGRAKHSLESFKAMQMDSLSPMARELMPILLRAEARSELGRQAKGLLAGWNGDMAANRPEPLIFAVWHRELTRLVYADEMGPLFAAAWGGRARFLLYVLDGGGGGAWCDDVLTKVTEECGELISRSLERAVEWLAERHGSEPARWRWGAVHRARARHLPFSEVPYLGRFFETGAELPGDTYSINVGHFAIADPSNPFAVVHAPTMRAIYDLDELDRSLFIHSTGQSGNPLSPLHDNFVRRWAEGEYITIRTARRDVEVGALGTLRLTPKR